MKLSGTEFQIKVWKEISKIPYGETRTYKDLAIAIGKPNSSRAVANACGKNPYVPQIPCHRVIRSDGKLGGYSGKGGVKKKAELLKREVNYFLFPVLFVLKSSLPLRFCICFFFLACLLASVISLSAI
jgi:methylated-DNA-[protein]-cysteine S-methyltransferase